MKMLKGGAVEQHNNFAHVHNILCDQEQCESTCICQREFGVKQR